MAITIEIKVVPKAGRRFLRYEKGGLLKCYLKSPPEDGKANKELIRYLSTIANVPQSDISIIKGASARNKVVLFRSLKNKEELCARLTLEAKDSCYENV